MPRPSSRSDRARNKFRPTLASLEARLVLSTTPVGPGANPADVLSYHDNSSLTGATTTETTLSPATVSPQTFGKVGSVKVDGQVYAQPLYVQSLKMSDGKVHSVLFVATENDSVYAIDANNPTAGPGHDGILWHDSFVNTKQGVTPVTSNDVGVTDITPNIGITGTPVIDPATNAIYFVTATKSQPKGAANPTYVQKLYALDLSSGQVKFGGPTTIGSTTVLANGTYVDQTNVSGPGTGAGSVNGVVKFNALREDQRSGLALDTNVAGSSNGLVIVTFASHGDINPYHGWVLGYDPRTLQLKTLLDTDPNGNFTGIWQSGAAPSIAPNGDIITTTGNGTFDAFTSTATPGATALGDSGPGLGYAGLNNSIAVKFDATDPNSNDSGTGLYYGGLNPVTSPIAPSVDQSLQGTGINFNQAALDPNGPHTFNAQVAYAGTSLYEILTDLTTGATYTHVYQNVNLPAAVGGTSGYVGFGGGDDGRHSIEDITNWTYTTNDSSPATIDHSAGFASNSDLTANGVASFTGTSAQLTDGGGEEAATIFANQEVNVTNFYTSFNFKFAPDPMGDAGSPIGNGITFIVQASNGHPAGQDHGESVLDIKPTPGTMTVVDLFTPYNYEQLITADKDPGSTATVLLPSFPGTAHPNLAVVAGKGGTIYLVDQANLGGYNPTTDNVIQEVNLNNEIYSSPVYLNGRVYYQANNDVLRSFSLVLNPATNTMNLVQDPITGTSTSAFPGPAPAGSSNGTTGGLIWTVQADNFMTKGPAVLRAYDATNLGNVLFDSSILASNQAGGSVKFVTPTIANGRVYVGLTNEVDIYGLLTGRKISG